MLNKVDKPSLTQYYLKGISANYISRGIVWVTRQKPLSAGIATQTLK